MSETTAAAPRNTVEQLVRKSDVLRLLNEYYECHTEDPQARTVIRAIRHDVRALPNTNLHQTEPATGSNTVQNLINNSESI